MIAHPRTSLVTLAASGSFFASLSLLPAGEVGPVAAFAPLPPVSDCDACNAPGWYGGVSLLYMKSYLPDAPAGLQDPDDLAEKGSPDGDWDFGARGTLGFEQPDGRFYELNGFWYEGDYTYSDDRDSSDEVVSNELSVWYIEGLVGDNLHCGEACLDIAFGIRYANWKAEDSDRNRENPELYEILTAEFEGIGPVIRIDGTRRLTDQVTLYGGLSQAILFGEREERFVENDEDDGPFVTQGQLALSTSAVLTSGSSTTDTLAFVTEIEAGLKIDVRAIPMPGAHIRLGVEGQYWSIDGEDFGLIGGVLGFGANF